MKNIIVFFLLIVLSGCGSNPKWGLDWSDNDGRTWSNQLFRSAGTIGGYSTQARWNRLGQFYDRTLRFTLSDPVPMAVNGAYVRVDLCDG